MSQKYTAIQKVALGFAAVFGALTVVMIVAFGGSKEEVRDPVRDAEVTEIKLQRMARGFVAGTLKDPKSAEFRNQTGVCGEVNAKNSFGGYGGFTRFIAAGESLVFMEGDPALARGAFQESWDRFCK